MTTLSRFNTRFRLARAIIEAEERLGRHGLDIDGGSVRFIVKAWPFKLPYIRRFKGYTLGPNTVLLHPEAVLWHMEQFSTLVAHEMAHIYQMRRDGHADFARQYATYLAQFGYEDNPYEVEARFASAP